MAPTSLMLLLCASCGASVLFWCLVGLIRFSSEGWAGRLPPAGGLKLTVQDVAVVIAAHNEEVALPKCLAALMRIIPTTNIYIASDGSRDRTVDIVRAAGCNVLDIQPNGGKALALDRAIGHFDLCGRYAAVLILDADSEIDPRYFDYALPLMSDAGVAVVAGHVLSRWRNQRWPSRDLIYAAYRTRLYRILQAVFQYGMSWRFINVSYIAPGFASLYRTSALRRIEITAPGLVIEDFNMTFEVHHKGLGRVAYSPRCCCTSEDPFSLRDYCKQVHRWYLGFWQTLLRNGVWPSFFWVSLGLLLLELVGFSLFIVTLPVFLAAHIALDGAGPVFAPGDFSLHWASPVQTFIFFATVDYALTVIVAIVERRPALLVYGPLFPALRILDAALFLSAFVKSFTVRSDGRWSSPDRRRSIDPSQRAAPISAPKGQVA